MTAAEMAAGWRELAGRAGIAEGKVEAIFQDLCRRYSEPGRAYHTLDHIAAMLDTVSDFRDIVHDDVAVRLAVWFHDAVYDNRRDETRNRARPMRRMCWVKRGHRLCSYLPSSG